MACSETGVRPMVMFFCARTCVFAQPPRVELLDLTPRDLGEGMGHANFSPDILDRHLLTYTGADADSTCALIGKSGVGMLTNKGKYGLKAMVHLAGTEPGKPELVAEIARLNHIPKKFLNAILNELRNAGLVRSKKGKGGGYALSRVLLKQGSTKPR